MVKVDKYICSTDFVVLDVDEDVKVPLIRGRAFLQTSKALIDMDRGDMTLWIGNEKLSYCLTEAMRNSLDFDDTCYFLDITYKLVDDYVQELIHPDPFEGWPVEENPKESKPENEEGDKT